MPHKSAKQSRWKSKGVSLSITLALKWIEKSAVSLLPSFRLAS
jgi:hypothetical protein